MIKSIIKNKNQKNGYDNQRYGANSNSPRHMFKPSEFIGCNEVCQNNQMEKEKTFITLFIHYCFVNLP